jgi:predicted short-subunit dehydrogenase-like oxidoreductase (DUF2520 family)
MAVAAKSGRCHLFYKTSMTSNAHQFHRVVVLGAGNVAWHLAPALEQSGHQIVAVYSRTYNRAAALASRLQTAHACTNLAFSDMAASIFVVAVPDQAIPEVMAQARFPKGSLVVHTSGSLPLTVLEAGGPDIRKGVLYPLQTFSQNKPVDFAMVPICVEGEDPENTRLLTALARTLTDRVYVVQSEERRQLHLAAVFACNFTNHLLGIGFDLLHKAGLPEQLLHPLVEETLQKALRFPPFTVQTGPAVRGDQQVVEEHLRLLADQPGEQTLYQLLSQSIRSKAAEAK